MCDEEVVSAQKNSETDRYSGARIKKKEILTSFVNCYVR